MRFTLTKNKTVTNIRKPKMAKKKATNKKTPVAKKTRKKRGPNKKKAPAEPLQQLVSLFLKSEGKKPTDKFDLDDFSKWVDNLKAVLSAIGS